MGNDLPEEYKRVEHCHDCKCMFCLHNNEHEVSGKCYNCFDCRNCGEVDTNRLHVEECSMFE